MIFLDFECMCGENILHNEIIQIGAIKVDVSGNIIDKFDKYVRPLKETVITKYCHELTGIKQEDIDNADSFDKVRVLFEEWVGHEMILTWGEDIKMWNHNCYLLETDNNIYDKFIDYQKIMKNHFKLKFIKGLDYILKSLNLTSVYSHNALDDAMSLYDYVKHINPTFDDVYLKNQSKDFECILTIKKVEEGYHFNYVYKNDLFGTFFVNEFTVFDKQDISLIRKEKEIHKNKGKLKKLKGLNIQFDSFESTIIFSELNKKYDI